MKFVTVRDFRASPAKIWRDLHEEQEMVITNNGKPIALLTPLGEDSLEDTLQAVRRARAQAAVERMRMLSRKNGNISLGLEEVQSEINKVRQPAHEPGRD